jgi:catechol 2,3-dioxygenase
MFDYGIPAPHYRLPAATRLGRVKLQVADLKRSMDFYWHVLGLRALERADDRAVLGPEGGEPIIELVERKGARPVPRSGLLGLYHFAILLPDRPSLARFLRHLVEQGARPGMSDHFVSEAIYLQDPDNLGIEVYADRPRSSWKVEQRQLAMATNPLDVEDLLSVADDTPWTDAPAGTRIGHVHLHVGDIDPAVGFYHDALGLDKIVWSYPGAMFFSAGGYHHHLGTNTWARGAPSASVDDARLVEWEIVVPSAADVEAVAESMRRGGADVSRQGSDAVVRDPWSIQLRVTSDPSGVNDES